MVVRSDSDRLRGFCDRLTDRQTDICNSRVAFATENNAFVIAVYLILSSLMAWASSVGDTCSQGVPSCAAL